MTDADATVSVHATIKAIAAYCPTDFVIWSFRGDTLILRGGIESSQWSALEITFRDVAYMALPVYMNSVTMRIGDKDVRNRIFGAFNALDDDESYLN